MNNQNATTGTNELTKQEKKEIAKVINLPLSLVLAEMFPKVKQIRTLTDAEKTLVEMLPEGSKLPDSFYVESVETDTIQNAIAILNGMLPSKKGGRKAGQPSNAPSYGFCDSAMSRLATAKREGKTTFAVGEKFQTGLLQGKEHINPQNKVEYDALIVNAKAVKESIKKANTPAVNTPTNTPKA